MPKAKTCIADDFSGLWSYFLWQQFSKYLILITAEERELKETAGEFLKKDQKAEEDSGVLLEP